jgi:AhpD family alkylhydroperoxidase
MPQVKLVAESDASTKAKAIYDDIKKTFGIPFVPNLFKAMGSNPDYLETTWNQIKTVTGPGELTRREKELVALGVSATNNCRYCIYAHTAAVKRLGVSDGGILELMAVGGLFNQLNKFSDGLMVEPDLGVPSP